MNSVSQTGVCVVGAGPYGLAIAAHLRHLGLDFRIFGSPMRRWLTQMPTAMLLKSEGCASNLPDPEGRHTLPQFCREAGLPFADYGVPLSREIFARYALCFQQKLVPQVEDVLVDAVSRTGNGFEVRLNSGEKLRAAQVIIATGMDRMEQVPEQLRGLPSELCSHSAAHYDLSKFKGKEVIVLGRGQSGLETAALLREEGASVTLVVRASTIAWNRVPSTEHRSFYQRLRRPRTQLGEGLQLWVYDNAPQLFHLLPLQVRLSRVKASLGPAGAWWLKDRVLGQMPILLGHQLRSAEERNGHIVLHLTDQNEQPKQLIADHVIAGTGYRFDFQKLPFLDEGLKSRIKHEAQKPELSSHFESSVPGLYFCGLASANSFGPVMRFLAGTGFTARRISTHIAKGQHSRAASFARLQKCGEN
ncbi:Dimethylaniline monooxygenase (N-oxide forming) [Candidatus Sulfotelmatobacter kueseliae]|uniref:Dimethylaniline monooxygenase (N-oxide forming) n=1 Tax=Candidatus Sulfotelmatobacter kueseliae TaxID=2042962 RepID=A0A2U3KKJ4_9BACT|nr:Dimethylaniline monooxygenase (N-oxide forming) [Candidatus Sulfotelmatobacter kueseliae]